MDGRRINLGDGEIIDHVLIQFHPPAVSFLGDVNELGPEAPPLPEAERYLPEYIYGEKFQIVFYRHETVSTYEALMRLIERYPQESAGQPTP